MMRRKTGFFLMLLGCCLLLASVSLVLYNYSENRRAEKTAAIIGKQLVEEIEKQKADRQMDGLQDKAADDEVPAEMAAAVIDGTAYTGMLQIPALGLALPVQNEWSYPGLQNSPCRYSGSAEEHSLVLAAHNYASHFGYISLLNEGDDVIFLDAEGKEYMYEVAEVTVTEPTDIESMINSEYDLTLFTCTRGGEARVTVRCRERC